jgi:histidinol-phosphate aminotransferase
MRGYGEPEALDFHGDVELSGDLIDLAVNVRGAPAPAWLAAPIAATLSNLGRYPDPRSAVAALAERHRRPADEVLVTAGAAQAFTLIAHATQSDAAPAVVVHPQFTEPEAALRAAGRVVRRLILDPADGFRFDPAAIGPDADLVMIGNPTNPTSVLHSGDAIAGLARPGRLLVVDEAFADTVPGEPESLASRRDVPGLIVIRSLTKTWSLAGLRIGYVLAAPEILARLARHLPLWPVSTPALAAAVACASPRAVAEERRIATDLIGDRDHLVARLEAIDGVTVAGVPASSFVLIHVSGGERVRLALRSHGYAVRRGDTFPGLGGDWLRIAVRDRAVVDRFADVLGKIVSGALR